MSWQVTWALIRALARGPSGTLMQSMPASAQRRAPSISREASTPRGGRISTKATNLPSASLPPSRDFSAIGTGVTAWVMTFGSTTVTASFLAHGCSERVSDRISLMCSGVVPQQPPTILTPAQSRRRAYCDIYSGEQRYMLRPSMRMGGPALGIALMGFEEYCI